MRGKWLLLCILGALIAAWPPQGAVAQENVPHCVIAGGGGVSSGSHIVYGTIGQPAIGVMTGPSNWAKGGFWYLAAISSTVDVAIVAFSSEIVDDAVVLTWTPAADASFRGYNVYRSETTEEAFTRINGELVTETTYRDKTVEPGKTYLYQIGAEVGEREVFSLTMSATTPPRPLTLYQNYPNPFNPSTSIVFYNPHPEQVSLVIYDVSGANVRTLLDRRMPVGKHVIPWDGTNDGGRAVGSGVYYYRLMAGKKIMTKKLVVVR